MMTAAILLIIVEAFVGCVLGGMALGMERRYHLSQRRVAEMEEENKELVAQVSRLLLERRAQPSAPTSASLKPFRDDKAGARKSRWGQ